MAFPGFKLTRRRLLVGVVLGFPLVVGLAIGMRPSGDALRMQGDWIVAAIEDSGVPTVDPFQMTRVFIFDGNKAVVRARNAPRGTYMNWLFERSIRGSSFWLDPNTSPKSIDMRMPDGTVMKGIYDWDGDRLKICLPAPSATALNQRPTRFSDKTTRNRLVTLERKP